MAERVNFTIPSADGQSQLHGVRWLPEGEPKAVLHITHGMVEYIERYAEFADYLTEQGFVVSGHDHIGHGESVTGPEEWGVMHCTAPEDVMTADMLSHLTMLEEEYPDLPIFMLGHSMGSYMLRKFLAEYPDRTARLSGAIIMGTGAENPLAMRGGLLLIYLMALVRGWTYRSKLIAGLTQGAAYKRFDGTGADPGRSWITSDEEKAKQYYSDPKCTFLFTLRAYKGLVSACIFDSKASNAGKVRKDLPLLFVSGQDDPVGNLGKGSAEAFELYKAAGVTDMTFRLYENDRHEILNETDRQMVFDEIRQWMAERM